MIDIIILIIIINVIFKAVKKKNEAGGDMRRASAAPNRPRKEKRMGQGFHIKKNSATSPGKSPAQPVKTGKPDILDKVSGHIYGTDADADDLTRYRRFLETERCTDIRRIAKEMKCTMYQVIREIQDFKDMGLFRNVEIDDDNYVIRYTDEPESDSADGWGGMTGYRTDSGNAYGGAYGGAYGQTGKDTLRGSREGNPNTTGKERDEKRQQTQSGGFEKNGQTDEKGNREGKARNRRKSTGTVFT